MKNRAGRGQGVAWCGAAAGRRGARRGGASGAMAGMGGAPSTRLPLD